MDRRQFEQQRIDERNRGMGEELKETVRIDGPMTCARCQGQHEDLEFKRLTHPPETGQPRWTHWALCPTNGEPIMLAIVSRDDVTQDQRPLDTEEIARHMGVADRMREGAPKTEGGH